mmetsp:Transcript_23991/g.78017  ORF Transcript_23991/g.78017 Transcript_23991/m.78017 type:complete len:200 (+) Transcript_23991:5674-6273(+)
MVMGTSLDAASTTLSSTTSGSKRPATSAPKMLLMAATDASGTLKMQNCLLRRFGMSFLPPPGVFIAARYCVSANMRMSPIGFSSWYIPFISRSWRTISLVTWSPQSFITGMLMSSTKTAIFLPPGGPYVRPWRFSTAPSTANWKMLGVVSDEKVIDLDMKASGSRPAMNWLMHVVLAVPGPPTSSDALSTELTSSRSLT